MCQAGQGASAEVRSLESIVEELEQMRAADMVRCMDVAALAARVRVNMLALPGVAAHLKRQGIAIPRGPLLPAIREALLAMVPGFDVERFERLIRLRNEAELSRIGRGIPHVTGLDVAPPDEGASRDDFLDVDASLSSPVLHEMEELLGGERSLEALERASTGLQRTLTELRNEVEVAERERDEWRDYVKYPSQQLLDQTREYREIAEAIRSTPLAAMLRERRELLNLESMRREVLHALDVAYDARVADAVGECERLAAQERELATRRERLSQFEAIVNVGSLGPLPERGMLDWLRRETELVRSGNIEGFAERIREGRQIAQGERAAYERIRRWCGDENERLLVVQAAEVDDELGRQLEQLREANAQKLLQLEERREVAARAVGEAREVLETVAECDDVCEVVERWVASYRERARRQALREQVREQRERLRELEDQLAKQRARVAAVAGQLEPNSKQLLKAEERDLAEQLEEHRRLWTCQVCKDRRRDIFLPPCGHSFCSVCIQAIVRERKRRCPFCQGHFDPHNVQPIAWLSGHR